MRRRITRIQPFSLRILPEVKQTLDDLSSKLGRTKSSIVEDAILEYAAKRLPLPNPTLYNPLTDLLTPTLTHASSHAQETHDHLHNHIPPPGASTDTDPGSIPNPGTDPSTSHP